MDQRAQQDKKWAEKFENDDGICAEGQSGEEDLDLLNEETFGVSLNEIKTGMDVCKASIEFEKARMRMRSENNKDIGVKEGVSKENVHIPKPESMWPEHGTDRGTSAPLLNSNKFGYPHGGNYFFNNEKPFKANPKEPMWSTALLMQEEDGYIVGARNSEIQSKLAFRRAQDFFQSPNRQPPIKNMGMDFPVCTSSPSQGLWDDSTTERYGRYLEEYKKQSDENLASGLWSNNMGSSINMNMIYGNSISNMNIKSQKGIAKNDFYYPGTWKVHESSQQQPRRENFPYSSFTSTQKLENPYEDIWSFPSKQQRNRSEFDSYTHTRSYVRNQTNRQKSIESTSADSQLTNRGYKERTNIRKNDSSYKNLMTLLEQEYITCIQASQLISDVPSKDDYYYRVYTLFDTRSNSQNYTNKSTSPKSQKARQLLILANTSQDGDHKNSNRKTHGKSTLALIEKCINLRKKQRNTSRPPSPALENTLGDRISKISFRNPRKLILAPEISHGLGSPNLNTETLLSREESSYSQGKENIPMSSAQRLRLVEKMYDLVLEIKVLEMHEQRGGIEDSLIKPGSTRFYKRDTINISKCKNSLILMASEIKEQSQSPRRSIENLKNKMKEYLALNPDASTPSPTFLCIMSLNKGLQLLPRFITLLGKTLAFKFFEIICKNANLIGLFNGKGGKKEIDTFVCCAVPSIVPLVMDLPLDLVTSCTSAFISRWTPGSSLNSRPGLILLTLVLSRAEMLKREEETLSNENSVKAWEEVYNSVLDYSKTIVDVVFPDSPVEGNECIYQWQFFTAIAVSASNFEQQLGLIMYMKDKILDAIKCDESSEQFVNMKLFLSALDLRVEDIHNTAKEILPSL